MNAQEIRELIIATLLVDVKAYRKSSQSVRHGIEQHLASGKMERFFVVIGRNQADFVNKLKTL